MSRRKEVKKLDAVFSKGTSGQNMPTDLVECVVLRVASRSQLRKCMRATSCHVPNTLPGGCTTRRTEWSMYCPAPDVTCTMFSQSYKFGKRLDAIYGEGTAERVHQASEKLSKFSLPDIVAMRKYYEKKLSEL